MTNLLRSVEVKLFHTKKQYLTAYNHSITPSNFNKLRNYLTFNYYTLHDIIENWPISDLAKLLFQSDFDTKTMRRYAYFLKNLIKRPTAEPQSGDTDLIQIVSLFYFIWSLKHKPMYIKEKVAELVISNNEFYTFNSKIYNFTYSDTLRTAQILQNTNDQFLAKNIILLFSLTPGFSNLPPNLTIEKIKHFHTKINKKHLKSQTYYLPKDLNNVNQILSLLNKQYSYKHDKTIFFDYNLYQFIDSLSFRNFTIQTPKTNKDLIQWSIALDNCLSNHVLVIKERQMYIFGLFNEKKELFAVFNMKDFKFIDINGLRNSLDLSPEFVFSLKVFIEEYLQEAIKTRKNSLYDATPWLSFFKKE